MTTFEKCKSIRRLILRVTAECLIYESWKDEYRLLKIREIPGVVNGWEKEYGSFKIDPNDLTLSEMDELGFMAWDESGLRLIPLWLFPFLAEEFESTCIDGETKVRKYSEIDNDHRLGCIAYGIVRKNTESTPND